MDQSQDFKSLQDEVQKALIATTRTAGQLASEDLAFQRSLNADVGSGLDEQSQRLLSLASALIKSAVSISELRAPILEDAEDVENNWRSVVDVVDSLLEKSDTCLDEYTGVIKRKAPSATEQVQVPSRTKKPAFGLSFRAQNLVKPQLAFHVKPNNNDNSPWKPLLTSKPHAILPLEESLGTFTNEFGQLQYKHPYETEILQLKYPETVYQKKEPIMYLPVETTSATFVDTEEGVIQMLEELKTANEIAIDLEHHDTRSYVGLVSLMQISTRHKDWIVDTLKPWRQKLEMLNEVFADPKILKVFHGAFMDIVWLQRDLGLYVVGLFDTHWASRTLGYAGGSLAFLLKKFIDFDADKKYQLADWRIRPLPEEMFFYARSDTHFLLYIYDMMRNELVERSNPENPEEDRVEAVLQKSKETSLLRYERQVYNAESGRGPGGWYSLIVKTPALYSNEQFAVFRAVHGWRDKVARDDDDSTAFIMPNHVVMSIAKIMPVDMVSLLSLANPVSHSVKSRAGELLDIIKSAKARGLSGPSMIDVLRPDTVGAATKASIPTVAEKSGMKLAVAIVDNGELRSASSSFWGGAFGSSVWDKPTLAHNEKIQLAVPLPALNSELFASGISAQPSPPVVGKEDEEERDHISFNADPMEEDAFVLKRSAKRKSSEISSPEGSGDTGDTGNDEGVEEEKFISTEQHIKAQKKARKAERKARQAAKKAAKKSEKAAAEADSDDEEEEEEAFDYSKAESVLHGKKRDGGKPESGRKKEKPFDPYTKSADAPKGMRKLQTERAGKSHTFKN